MPCPPAWTDGRGGRLCYFSLRGGTDMPDFLRSHIESGGLALVREANAHGGEIVIHDKGDAIHLMHVAEIPATLEGLAEFNVQNALAAAAVCYAHGLPPATIRTGLASFTTSFEHSPGRLNVFDGHGFRVILDYAHNPAGLMALGDLILKMHPRHRRTIGMVNIPGDRRDEDIREMGALAARYFDEIIFREDPARRGRRPGEIVSLLTEGACAVGFPQEQIRRILDEDEAANACLGAAQPGDLVVLTPTEVEVMWRQVLDYRAPAHASWFPVKADQPDLEAESWRRIA
ncbi:glutamate ligase domain-containing protein [Geminicoccus flavidas]|uniref:glutamate ligase domain-containing protein n=1 Tax=Geminicoccus flavidas TaxID=2506407 RepID=UPI00190F5F2D|nr:cyanophycin synthetase [Geminicoccus flavidas]